MSLKILFQSDRYVAIDKPTGLFVHKTHLDPTVKVVALQLLRDQIGQRVYPVHRLDRATSGVLLFALDQDALKDASTQFEQKLVKKTYVAIVRGRPEESGVIIHPVDAKQAITQFRRIQYIEIDESIDKFPQTWYSLVELHPKTGRTHQLRKHLKHLGHPIIGDSKYGKSAHNRYFHELFGHPRLYLHCCSLELSLNGQPKRIDCPLSSDFQKVLDRFQWSIESSVST